MPLQAERSAVSALLEEDTFNQGVRDELSELNRRLGALALRSRCPPARFPSRSGSLQGSDLAWLKLQEARSRSDEARDDLRLAEARRTELQSRIEAERTSLQGIEEQADELPGLARRLREGQSVVGRGLAET